MHKVIPMEKLLSHEEFREDHAVELKDWLERENCQIRPIVISPLDEFDRNGFYVIHDGHHRVEGLKRLGCKLVLAEVIDFFESKYKALEWNLGNEVPKIDIIDTALSGTLAQSRWTRHMVEHNGEWKPFMDNDVIEPKVNFPLSKLKKQS